MVLHRHDGIVCKLSPCVHTDEAIRLSQAQAPSCAESGAPNNQHRDSEGRVTPRQSAIFERIRRQTELDRFIA
jgi:hypothetical protein